MELPIVIYWGINILLFVLMYCSRSLIPVFIWSSFCLGIWIYEGIRYGNYIDKYYPKESAMLTKRKVTLKEHLRLYKTIDDDGLKTNQKRIKQILISEFIWFVMAPIVSVLGVI